MGASTTAAEEIIRALEISVENMQLQGFSDKDSDGTTSKLLNPFEELSLWKRIKVVENNENTPEPMQKESDVSEVIFKFKKGMQNLQKTIALEHALKVKKGKESLEMNEVLRQTYCGKKYYFPNRVLNTGLQKKDFMVPFLINVQSINQDLGALLDQSEGMKSQNFVKVKIESEFISANEASSQQHLTNNTDSIILAPELLGQPPAKKLKLEDEITPVADFNIEQNVSKKIEGSEEETSRIEKNFFVTKSSNTSELQQTRSASKSSMQTSIGYNLAKGKGNAVTFPCVLPKKAVTKQPLASKTPLDLSRFVPIRPKLPAAVAAILKPQIHLETNPPLVKNPLWLLNIEQHPDADSGPKIISIKDSAGIEHIKNGGTIIKSPIQMNPNPISNSNKNQNTYLVLKDGKDKLLKNNNESLTTAVSVPSHSLPSNLKRKSKIKIDSSGLLGCSICGKTFPSNSDNKFRLHMILSHNQQVSDSDIFEAKIPVKSLFKCKTCNLIICNNLQFHHRSCCPHKLYSNVFKIIPLATNTDPKFSCGICPSSFESRIHLRSHLIKEHPDINKKILLDPYFRCGICLLRFKQESSSGQLIKHAVRCCEPNKNKGKRKNKGPSVKKETIQELAQLNLHCQICNKKHEKICETLHCYQLKNFLRCIICLQVFTSRTSFSEHLKDYHGGCKGGICCPFCDDGVVKPTLQTFEHIIDSHYCDGLKYVGTVSGDAAFSIKD